MATKDYSNVLGSVLDDLEKRKNNQQNENYRNQLAKSPYADVYRSLGLLSDSGTSSSGTQSTHYSDPAKEQIFNPPSALSTPLGVVPQLSDNPALMHNMINAGQTNNPTLNSFRIAEQNRQQQERRQAISQAMQEGFLSTVKGGQPAAVTETPVVSPAPSAPAVSDPMQRILDLVSGNAADTGTRNPALPEVTASNGTTADDWRIGIRGTDKLRSDGRNYSTINQTDNDPLRNSPIDKILDSLDYIRARGANALEGAYQNFRSVDAGLSNAASAIGNVFKTNAGTASNGLKTPNLNPFSYTNNRPVMQSSANSDGRIKSQEELSETAGASNLRGKANEAYTRALEDSANADAAGKQLAEIEKKYGAVNSNPVTRTMADLGAAIDGQIPYVALNAIPGVGTALSASARAALSSVDAYKEARSEGATKTQARAYSGREAINQGVGDLLIGGIAGRGQGALGKIMANTKVGRALARAYGTHITSPALKTGIKYFGTMLGEGGEEALQKLIEVGNKRATYNPNAKVTGAELAYEGILGGLTAGVFNAVDVPTNYRAYKSDFDTVNELSKAAAAVTSFEESRYVTLQCDILLDECNIALGETAAPVNETDFDTRARYEYIKNGVERIKSSLQTDTQAIIDSNTRFDEDVSFAADAPADNIVNEVANIVVDVAETLDPDADVIRGTIDRVNDEIRDINETEESVRQMSQEEFENWFYNSRFKHVFPNIADAVHGSTERLLSAPRTYDNDTSVVTDNQTAENIVRHDMAAQMKAMLDELKVRKEVLNQINSTLRNQKGEVEEAVTGLLTDTDNGGTIESENPVVQADGQSLLPAPAVDTVQGEPKYTVTRKSYTHTQNGEKFDLIQPDRKLTSEEYAELKQAVRDSGGYWSKYAKGFLIPEGKFDGVQNALNGINVGINENAAAETASETPATPPVNETENTGRGETTTERIPEFVVGGPSESAGAETITAERPDIPRFEVAGNTDIVPGGETGIRSEAEPAVNDNGTNQAGTTDTDTRTGANTTTTRTVDETATANVEKTPAKNTQVSPVKEPKQEEDLSMFEEEDRPKRLGFHVGEDGVSDEWREQVEQISKELPNIDGRFISNALDELMDDAEQFVPKTADGKYDLMHPAYYKWLPQTAERVARNMVDNADFIKVSNTKYPEIKEARDFLRTQKIHYDRAKMVAEIGDEQSFIRWRASMRGRLNLTADMSQGRGADQVFQEFADKFPGYVDLTVWNELDQLKELAQAADELFSVSKLKYVEEGAYEDPVVYGDAVQRGAVALYSAVGNRLAGITKPFSATKPVSAETNQSPNESTVKAKWTPDSQDKLTGENFPYELGTMVDHTSVATGQNVREFLVDHDNNGVVIGTDGKYKTVKYEDFERLIRNGYYRIYDPVSDNVTNHFVNEYRNQQKETEKAAGKPVDREPVTPTAKPKPETAPPKESEPEKPAEKTTGGEETVQDTKPYTKIADWVADRLGRGMSIDKKDLQVVANDAYGGTQAEGAYTVKDMTDALELGINKYIIKDIRAHRDAYTTPEADGAAIVLNDFINQGILGKIPTQTGRTEEQVAMQQFSTPPNIAFVANWVANIDKNDTVLEPSAGIGGLASFAKGMGAKTIVNELSERRLFLLKTLPFDGFYHENAEQIDNILPDSVKPTVVVMNPPFSANGRTKNKTANAIPHIEQALARLEDGGRLVAILGGGREEGGGMSDKAPAFRAWWNQLREDYSIRANIGIEGSNYKKYGTSFNVRLVVIDKTGAQKEPTLTGEYKDLSEAIKDLEEIRNDRTRNQGAESGQRNGTVSGGGRSSESGTAQGGKRPDSGRGASDRGEQNQPGEQPEGEAVRSGQSGGSDRGADLESETQSEGEVPRADGERGSGQGGERGPAGGSDSDSEGGERGSGRVDSADAGTGASGESGELVRPGTGVSGTAVNEAENKKPETVDDTSVMVPTDTTAPGASGTLVDDERKKKPKKQKKAAENDDGVYANYRTADLTVKGAKKHPAVLVESSAMSAVQAPPLTYVPMLDQKLIEAGVWSDAQLETISYAGQAHQDHLPDGKRKGYFIGDGTGVGKGRQIAGIIMDSFAHGHKKAVWISEKAPLIEDARRDWEDAGGDPAQVWEFAKENNKKKQNAKKGKKYDFPESGILFVPYSTLRAGAKNGQTNVEVIEEWLGKKTSDCIIFDEAHNMANLEGGSGGFGKKKPSQMAIAGNKLQDDLPDASVVYLSATGATNIENLAYASRLGLWGEKTAFENARDFASKIGSACISAMELVARDMKAMGVYLARSISYDGVVYDNITHNLSDVQTAMYDRMSEGWQVVLQNFDKALHITGGENNAEARRKKSNAYSIMQMFYNQVLTSMSMPTVIKDIEKELKAGHSCVIQLVNTQEAALKKALSDMKAISAETGEDEDFDNLDLTPRDALITYVKESFPVQQYEATTDKNGNEVYVPVTDSNGDPVLNKQAVRMRDALIEDLNNISVPEGPLDMLILHFGADAVAEVSGRTNRLVNKVDEHGNVKKTHERRDSKKANVAEGKAFQDGKKRILVFSSAGATGRSFHADKRAKNQQQRVHYVLQPGWRADQAVQGFGRTHRSNQVSAPIFRLVSTNVMGHKRFVTSIARRLDQLGALTKGQRETGSGVFGEKDNLESPLSSEALRLFYKTLARNGYKKSFDLDGEAIFKKLGLYEKFFDEFGNYSPDNELAGKITTFLNRLLALPVDEQNRVFSAFEAERDRMYTAAIESGTLDRGLENVKADKIDIADEEVVYTDPKTGAETKYIRAKLYDKPEVVTTVAEAESKYPGFTGIYRLPDGSVKAAYRRRDGTDPTTGNVYRQFILIGPNQGKVSNYRESTLKASCTEIPKKEWQAAWDEDLKEVPAYNESEVHMITGALLPIWGKLPENGNIKARRITASDGEQYLGRIIAPDLIDSVLRGLSVNVKKEQHTGAELRDAILKQGKTVTFNGDTGGVITVSKKRVSGENRMEIVAPNMYGFKMTHPDIISEYVQYRNRYFIPDNKRGEALLQKLSDENGVRSIGESENSGQLYSVGSGRGRWGKGKRDRSAEVRSINDLVDEAQRIFGIPMNTGKMGNMPRSAQGVFKEHPETIRTRQYGDLPTIAHEIGHWFDKKYDLHSSPYIASVMNEFETDLKRNGYSDSLISRESVAEYFREYMSDREATEQKFPQFTNWMYKKLNTSDNRRLLEFSGMANAYFAADLDRRASAQVHYRTDDNSVQAKVQVVSEQLKRNPQDYLGTLSRTFVRNVFDDLIDLRGFGRTYDLAYYEKQARSIAYGRLTSAFTDKNGNVVGKSLADILSDGKIDERNARAFDEYLIARVALDHFEAAENGEKVGTLIYGDEELNDADSIAERIDKYERENPTFHQASEEVYQYERNLLDLAVNSGLMSEELRDRLNELYPHYVPLFRVMDDRGQKAKGAARGYANQNTPIARFKGSGRDIWSPIESIITNTEKFTAACMRNDVMMEFTNFIDRNEGFGWAAERIPQAKILDFISTDELGKKLDYFTKNTDRLNSMNELQKADLVSDIMEFIGDTLSQWKPAAKQGKNVVSVMRNGKRQYYEVHDQGLFKALTNMDAPQFDLLTKFFGAVTRMNKFFYTTSNPQFVFTNPQRDIVTGFISSTTTDNPGKYLWDFGKAWMNAVTNSDEYKEYVRNGGGYMGSVTSDYNILKRVKKDVIPQNKSQIKRFMDVVSEIVPRLVDAGETASRLAEWKRAIAQGDNYMEALRKAQEVTVNFARGGRVVKQINQYIPFFQAGFNALAHNYDLFVNGGDGGGGRNGNNGFGLDLSPEGKRRRRRAWIKWFLTTGLLAMLTWLYNYVIAPKITGESEEEVKQSYDNLSNYNKNAFYNMYIGDDKFIRIKKTQDMSVPATIVERMAEYYVLGQKDSLNGLADFVFDNILPANPHSVGDVLSDVSGIGTFVDLYRNEDFKGSPILSSRYQYLPKEEQYKENTSQVWIALGRAIGQSPIQLQYAAEDNFGWAARLIDNLTPYNGERSLGIKNKLVVDSVYSTDTINNFYDQKDYYDKASKAYKANPNSKRYSLEDVLGAYKYSKIADLYSDLNNRTRDERDNDLSREMRRRTNALIQTVNEDGISEIDRAVIDLAETTGTDIGDIAPYLVTPDHISVKVDKKNVSLDMDYDDMYTYYTQAQTAFENVYGRIIQAGYDDATTAALMVEARKVINKELRDTWGRTLLRRKMGEN